MNNNASQSNLEQQKKKLITLGIHVSLWDLIVRYTIRDTIIGILRGIPATFGVGLRMFLYPLFFKHCGRGLTVKQGVTFQFPERISIGDQVGINEYTWLGGDGGIDIGDFVRIAPHVSIVSFNHAFADRNTPIKLQPSIYKKVVIEDDVWIGTHAVILAGIRVGKGAVIGAGSVVTKDVPPYTIVAGVPARVIKERK